MSNRSLFYVVLRQLGPGVMLLTLATLLSGCASPAISPCLLQFLPESPTQREARHTLVAMRRVGPVVIVHRGMWAAAPENTLTAYAAADIFGADAIELDIRRTADGVLVCFHDDGIVDRLLYGFGAAEEMTYAELEQLSMRRTRAGQSAYVPTVIGALELARQRGLLLHLDIKQRGLDADIAAILDAGDLWRHVVYINRQTGGRLLTHPKYEPLNWKADAALYENRRDMDPATVQATLNRPGEMVIVDDPRVAAWILNRRAAGPLERFAPLNCPPPIAEPREPRYPDQRARVITERAQHALAAELARSATQTDIDRFRRWLAAPGMHRDYRFHALDAAAAVRAFSAMRYTDAVPEMVAAFRRIDPRLNELTDGGVGQQYPATWHEFRLREAILVALGELRTTEARAFLFEYLDMSSAARRALGPPFLEIATRSLLRHDLSAHELDRLLTHSQQAVRGTATLILIDNPSRQGNAALERNAAWALQLPSLNRR